jgi:hypothetical protein
MHGATIKILQWVSNAVPSSLLIRLSVNVFSLMLMKISGENEEFW